MSGTFKDREVQRQQLIYMLYSMIDELEHPSKRRRDSGFPFNILEKSAYAVLDGLQLIVETMMVPWIEKQLERFRR